MCGNTPSNPYACLAIELNDIGLAMDRSIQLLEGAEQWYSHLLHTRKAFDAVTQHTVRSSQVFPSTDVALPTSPEIVKSLFTAYPYTVEFFLLILELCRS